MSDFGPLIYFFIEVALTVVCAVLIVLNLAQLAADLLDKWARKRAKR